MRRIAVGDIMTRNFISVKPTTTLLECAKIIVKNKINTLPVTYGKRLVGLLKARDILWAITKKPNIQLSKIFAIDIANRKVAVIKPSADISQAITKMRALDFRSLPVISKGELIGIITLKDILRIEPEVYKDIGELARIREEERKLKNLNKKWPLEGLCDNCGSFSELLSINGQLLCFDCREELY